MSYKDPEKRREYRKKYREKYQETIREQKKIYREKNKEQVNKKDKEYLDDRKKHAYDSIKSGSIINSYKWDLWCDEIKRKAKQRKHPFSVDFTNDVIFTMLIHGCFYCGDVATSIDRLNSDLGHTPKNCVGCCYGCNFSKGTADPSTFIRKSYFKARGKYVDEVSSVWFVNKNKPRWCAYKGRATKKGVPFDLTKGGFDVLITGDCKYCHRSPTTWFGIDRVIPARGYVNDNVVTCCYDCNMDKYDGNVDTMTERNIRIADRVDSGDLIIKECTKVILHTGKNLDF